MLKVEVLEAIRNPHQVRILLLLNERKVMRFNQIQDALGLNPAQVDRALKRLYKGLWIGAKTVPGPPVGNAVRIEYEITTYGETLAQAFLDFAHRLQHGPSRIVDPGLDALVAADG